MKYLKLALISLIILAVFVTLLSLFFPSSVRISKAIDIQSNRDSLFSMISDPGRWQQWYPGLDSVEPVQLLRRTVGYRLNSQGALLRLSGKSDSTVSIGASGPGIRDIESVLNVFNTNAPNTYTVQWYTDFKLKWYPWEKFSGMLMEKRYGPTMEKGLENLKNALQNR